MDSNCSRTNKITEKKIFMANKLCLPNFLYLKKIMFGVLNEFNILSTNIYPYQLVFFVFLNKPPICMTDLLFKLSSFS